MLFHLARRFGVQFTLCEGEESSRLEAFHFAGDDNRRGRS